MSIGRKESRPLLHWNSEFVCGDGAKQPSDCQLINDDSAPSSYCTNWCQSHFPWGTGASALVNALVTRSCGQHTLTVPPPHEGLNSSAAAQQNEWRQKRHDGYSAIEQVCPSPWSQKQSHACDMPVKTLHAFIASPWALWKCNVKLVIT
jgi:hypothetical protein